MGHKIFEWDFLGFILLLLLLLFFCFCFYTMFDFGHHRKLLNEIKDTNNSYLLYVKKINWGSQSLSVVALCENDWGTSQSFLYLQSRMHGHRYGCMDMDTDTGMCII